MTPKALLPFLVHAFKHNIQTLIKGPPGVGKSDIIRLAAAAVGFDFDVWHPTVWEPTDPKGLPALAKDGDHATFLPYGDLWHAIQSTKALIILLDDLGHADEGVQKALMQLLLARRINGHKLPDHVLFVAATNDIKQQAGVRGLIEPVKSRFHVIVELQPSPADWKDWAIDHGVNPVVIAFHEHPTSVLPDGTSMLFNWKPTKEIKNQPCPRTWKFFSDLYTSGVSDPEVWEGCIGREAATAFAAFEQMATGCPTNTEIFTDPHGTKIPDEPALRYLTAINLGREVSKRTFEQAWTYLERGEQPYRFLTLQHATRREAKSTTLRQPDKITSHPLWLKLVSSGGELNALASATLD